ncbi:MAG: MerR family DNA-binding transcriptional regulator [Planctomycetota bacterium]
MAELPRSFSIGVLVRRFNVSAESLRNWERAGLIPPAHRTPGGHRRYGQDHVAAVHSLLYAPAVRLGVDDSAETADEELVVPGRSARDA